MKCIICGNEEHPEHYSNQDEMETHKMCFHCNFWREMLEKDSKRAPYTWCMIDGTHYVIEPDDPGNYFQGFGGAEFHIKFNDGHEVITHNLWCQGEPEGSWKEKFPNNANFDWQWRQIGNCRHLVPKEEEISDSLIAQAETAMGM